MKAEMIAVNIGVAPLSIPATPESIHCCAIGKMVVGMAIQIRARVAIVGQSSRGIDVGGADCRHRGAEQGAQGHHVDEEEHGIGPDSNRQPEDDRHQFRTERHTLIAEQREAQFQVNALLLCLMHRSLVYHTPTQ